MRGLSRWNPIEDVFSFQREIDHLFNQFWNDLPTRTASSRAPSFQVHATDEGWRLEVPLAGFDPQYVHLEVAGNTLTIRAEEPAKTDAPVRRYEQTFTVPQFLDLDKITASHRHGMLHLTLPLKESVKPRRIQIEGVSDTKRLTSAA